MTTIAPTDSNARSRSVIIRPPTATMARMGMARRRASSPLSMSTASAIDEPPAVNITAWNIEAAVRNNA